MFTWIKLYLTQDKLHLTIRDIVSRFQGARRKAFHKFLICALNVKSGIADLLSVKIQPYCSLTALLFLVSVFSGELTFAQKTPIRIDTTHIYKKIEAYSGQNRYAKIIYPLIFKPAISRRPGKNIHKKGFKPLKQRPYSSFEGKIIRHINIETLDPFGFSVTNFQSTAHGWLYKTGNELHVKSLHITIRNLLLIRQNQVFDSLLVKESERLVRSRKFVRDVSFIVVAAAESADSVDIFIRELDNWSIMPALSASSSSFTIHLSDVNFLGLGHESQNGFTLNHSAGDYAYNLDYIIPNIRNTYISMGLHSGTEESGNFTRSITIDRPFFSPFAKWAAGINFSRQFRMDYIHAEDSALLLQNFRFNVQDYWVGKATQIFKGNTENDRTTNFITSVRYTRIRYFEKPMETFDPQHYFDNSVFYLASAGISTRKYMQDKFIFKYGVAEDVPIGKVYNLTAGIQKKNNTSRLYLGARISEGNYYSWGYLSFNCEYGAFFHASHTEQGVFTAGINYFTGLVQVGKWKFRQFLKPQLTIGINSFAYDSITLNDGFGMDGFNSLAMSGSSRLLFMIQTQSYSPWKFIGFHFGPYLTFSLGMLGEKSSGFKNSKLYSQLGLGVLIKNEHLIINTFQLSISYFPIIPGKGSDVIKMNTFRTTDFGFRDFETGKPAVVMFR